ncbi:hypothetical protein DV737_g3542, partial [Chaetothyriales sp. CBS 132003]
MAERKLANIAMSSFLESSARTMRTARHFTRSRAFQQLSLARTFHSSHVRYDINKIVPSAAEAIKDLKPNSIILCGGFGLCGVPDTLINEVAKNPRITGLTAVSNNAGIPGAGLGQWLETRQIKRMIASYVGENKVLEGQYMNGEVELELTPQGTLAQRCDAGGKGIPAFYTPAGFGTAVQTGEIPLKFNPDGTVAEFSKPKDVKVFNGKPYVMEEAIPGDYAFVKAYKADKLGNVQFRLTGQNFNAAMGRNAKVTIVEAEHIVEPGDIPPEAVHLPGIYVSKVIQSVVPKGIEKYVNAPDQGQTANAALGKGEAAARREKIVKRAAKEFKNGMYANLGIGMPMSAPSYLEPSVSVTLQSENGILGLGPYPKKGEEDADLINAGKETVTLLPGASTFGSEESFGMIRSGRIDLTMLGAFQVSARGDLANWAIPGQKVKGFGGAMDLVSNRDNTKVVVLMEHTDKKGNAKIVKTADFPLTGKQCAVFDVDWTNGLTLVELAEGVTVEEVQAKTSAPFVVAETLGSF